MLLYSINVGSDNIAFSSLIVSVLKSGMILDSQCAERLMLPMNAAFDICNDEVRPIPDLLVDKNILFRIDNCSSLVRLIIESSVFVIFVKNFTHIWSSLLADSAVNEGRQILRTWLNCDEIQYFNML